MNASNWISLGSGLIAGLGFGSVVTALIQHFLKQKEVASQSQREDLERRYRVIILLMYAAFDFEDNKAALRINRPDLTSQQAVLNELKAEWFNMLLFASSRTLDSLRDFMSNPDKTNLKATAFAMREDLGRERIDLEI